VLLHYLVRNKFSKIAVIRINAYRKTYLLKQFSTNLLIKVKLHSVLDTLSVLENKSRCYCVK